MKLLGVLFLLCMVAMMESCIARRVAIVENVVRDSFFVARHELDSVYRQDSVLIYNRGDTVYVDRLKYAYRYRVKRDTFLVHHSDTINVPVYVSSDSVFFGWKRYLLFLLGTFILFVLFIRIKGL